MNEKGKLAEKKAVEFLCQRGYLLLSTNYRCKYGEIDIIAKDGETLCFVEVKSRVRDDFYFPAEAVTIQKQAKIIRSALFYLKENYSVEPACRFDVVSILSDQEPEIIQDAFQVLRR